MLISTTEELRLYSPANAIDHFDTLAAFLDSSEHDFLSDKLGPKLHAALSEYYANLRHGDGIATFLASIESGTELPPYARLLTLAQRILTYDALGRAIDLQAISVNGAGVNVSVADDYPKAEREAIVSYKQTCVKEAHAAVNRLLVLLEEWTQEVADIPAPSISTAVENGSSSVSSDDIAESDPATEKAEIVTLWRTSRYYYLAAGLAIPSATILQEYLNIYDSREKFITLLPDLRYIQEDIIAPIIGEDFLDYLITYARSLPTESIAAIGSVLGGSAAEGEETDDPATVRLMARIIHRLRKAVARHLESRLSKIGDARRETAHSEAVRLTSDLSEYLTSHQPDFSAAALRAFQSSPLYVATATPETDADSETFENNSYTSVIFVTPALN